jgi:hypothetical protein
MKNNNKIAVNTIIEFIDITRCERSSIRKYKERVPRPYFCYMHVLFSRR